VCHSGTRLIVCRRRRPLQLARRCSAGGATQVGAGIGVGSFGATGTTTVIYDALVSQSIAPHLALQGRLYFGPQRPSTLFAGLRLAL